MGAHQDRVKSAGGQTRQPTIEEYNDLLRETLLSAGEDITQEGGLSVDGQLPTFQLGCLTRSKLDKFKYVQGEVRAGARGCQVSGIPM